jgi:hypothetical protein
MVSILKALVYSLNDPVVELLYLPTSEPIKFKAKAWIDVVGARSAKAIGSLLTIYSHGDIRQLRRISEIPLLIIAVILIMIVWITGKEFDHLIKKGEVIGEEKEGEERDKERERVYSDKNKGEKKGRMVNGLYPGDVGYQGYDPEEVFEGVNFDVNVSSIPSEEAKSERIRSNSRGIEPFHMEDFHSAGEKNHSTSIWR